MSLPGREAREGTRQISPNFSRSEGKRNAAALAQSTPLSLASLRTRGLGIPWETAGEGMGEDEGQSTLGRQLTFSHLGLFDQTQILAASWGCGVSWRGPGGRCTPTAPLAKARN